MNTLGFEPATIAVAFLVGLIAAAVLLWIAAIVPARREAAGRGAELEALRAELATERILIATLRFERGAALESLADQRAVHAETLRNLERSRRANR